MTYVARLLGREYVIAVDYVGERIGLEINGRPVEFRYTQGRNRHRFLMLLDSKSYDVEVSRQNGRFLVTAHGREFEVFAEDQRLDTIRKVAGLGYATDQQSDVRAPMPGLVVRVLKQTGERVSKGEGLVIMEAMKMENELKSPRDGEVGEVLVTTRQSVEKGECLVRLK
jgi:biotin carboxyl carrier protein